jgi:predicted  nucleic acid-binding Zn-ribbon protein
MGETKSEPENSSNVETANEAQDGIAGRDVLILLRRSAELADGNSRYAVEIAQKMSDQLWAAQKKAAELQARVTELEAQVQLYPTRIADLEAEVQLYRDKSEKAEQWLGKISNEIQQRVLGGDNQVVERPIPR